MKRLSVVFLVFLMLFAVGCGGSTASPLEGMVVEGSRDVTETAVSGSVSIINETSYTFIELYSTPSSSADFGEELLEGTRIDPGVSVSINFGNLLETQDFLIIDNDGDAYSIIGIPLMDAQTMSIDLVDSDGVVVPRAYIFGSDGSEISTVDGLLIPNSDTNATGYDTNGYYTFTVNNNSDYDIYSIHVGITNASSSYDIDVLPEILPAKNSIEITGFATQGDWQNTEWTLYITDVDGDTSASFETFNPWTVTAIDAQWDSNVGGYVVDFIY